MTGSARNDLICRIEPCRSCEVRARSVCVALESRELSRLAELAQPLDIPPGRTFVVEGEPATYFFNLTHGVAKLFKQLPDGRQQITGFPGPGTFVGLAAVSTYPFGAETLGPVRLCRFSHRSFDALCQEFPHLQHRLLQTACAELAAAQDQMLLLGRQTARERVASFLLARAGSFARAQLPMTRTDIADYLGLTIETVSRTLTLFRGTGLITLTRPGEAWIQDRPSLEAIAAGDEAPISACA